MKVAIIISSLNGFALKLHQMPNSTHNYNVAKDLCLESDLEPFPESPSSVIVTFDDVNLMCDEIHNRKRERDKEAMQRLENLRLKDGVAFIAPFGGTGEVLEHLNDCVQPWLQIHFSRIFKVRGFTWPFENDGRIPVAVHLRFGDVKGPLHQLDSRSISIHQVNFIFQEMNKSRYTYYLFMEDAPSDIQSYLDYKVTLVKNEGDLHALFLYSQMRCYIQGVSSWSVVGALLGEGVKDVITNDPRHQKYNYRSKQVARVFGVEEAKNFCLQN